MIVHTHGRVTRFTPTLTRVLVAALLVIVPNFVAATGSYAQTASSSASPVTRLPPGGGAKAPCVVTGYTLHADQQMASRRITSDYVENVVYKYCSRAKFRASNSTWQYSDGKIVVSANSNGYVITVIRR